MSFRAKLAVGAAKLTSTLIRKMKRGSGVTLPGFIARIICPNILSIMASMVKKRVIVTMGTNGKTTTNALMYQILRAEGNKVIINKTGANMLNGIISAFVLETRSDGTLDADYACLEVDEIASAIVLPMLKPHCALLTNISRDQLDRFGEVDAVYQKIKTACKSSPNSTLIINCDDVLSYTLAVESGNPIVTYGINDEIFDEISRSEIRESTFCLICNQKLGYTFFHYGQLGMYNCPNCHIERPNPDYIATNVNRENEVYSFLIRTANDDGSLETSSFKTGRVNSYDEISIDNENTTRETHVANRASKEATSCRFIDKGLLIHSSSRNTYNIYNTLSAVATICTLEADVPNIKKSIEDFDFGNNREDIFNIDGARVQLHLAKNPIGFQQKMSLILKDKELKDIVILINDTYQDGEDVSWLWDVDFQHLAKANARTLIAAGSRKYDVGLRLKYEDISCDFTDNIQETIKDLIGNGTKNIYLVINYSSLYSINRFLNMLATERKVKED